MDGIFVAYHNTNEIFGFQYVPRETMDTCLYGGTAAGDAAFSLIFQLYHELLQLAFETPSQRANLLRLTLLLPRNTASRLTVFVDDGQYGPEDDSKGIDWQRIRQFTVTGHLTARGLRQEHLDIQRGQDLGDVQFHLTVTPTAQVNRQDFLAARARVWEPRAAAAADSDHVPEINERIMRMLAERQQTVFF
jgi:hypothetical protein